MNTQPYTLAPVSTPSDSGPDLKGWVLYLGSKPIGAIGSGHRHDDEERDALLDLHGVKLDQTRTLEPQQISRRTYVDLMDIGYAD